ncbi:MAG: dUTP diphosphatase [Pseudomonadaceae bacterium]|nr:dUTP diphosphatase [Pseudomonadaceae bacterium]
MDFDAWLKTPPLHIRVLPNYKVDAYGLPAYQTADGACFDMVAALDVPSITLAAGETRPIPTGLGLRPDMAHPVFQQRPMVLVPELTIRSRSGLAAKFGVHALGGVIDYTYPDEMKVILHNGGSQPFVVEDGMRIAQASVQLVWRVGGVAVKEAVRQGGFGSTGG